MAKYSALNVIFYLNLIAHLSTVNLKTALSLIKYWNLFSHAIIHILNM